MSKRPWTQMEEFDPASVGWKYDPNMQLVRCLQDLLIAFDQNSPKPGHLNEFVACISVDPIGFYQLVAELQRRSEYLDLLVEFTRGETLFNLPVTISGHGGDLGLVLKPCIAPSLLRHQVEFEKVHGNSSNFGTREQPPPEPEKPRVVFVSPGPRTEQ